MWLSIVPMVEQEVAVKNDLGKVDEALHASSITEAGMSEIAARMKHSQNLTSCRSQRLKVNSKYEDRHVSTHN